MASVSTSKTRFRFFFMVCICCSLVSRCKSDEAAFDGQKTNTADIVGRAIICLSNRYIYSACEESYRLGPQGTLNVPAAAADAFCGGPCLEETELVLRCIDDIMENFRFYNGAVIADVRFALDRGCGHSGLRGDFDVQQRLGGDGHYDDNFFYNHGSSGRSVSCILMVLMCSVVAMLLWG